MRWAPGITEVRHADANVIRELLKGSPAAVNPETGVCYVDPTQKLHPDVWDFVLLHENGHVVRRTTSELEADEWAHREYLKDGKRSLKQSMYALLDHLNFDKSKPHMYAQDMARALAQLRRCQEMDKGNVAFAGWSSFNGSETDTVIRENDYNRLHMPYGFGAYDSSYNEFYTGNVFGNSRRFEKYNPVSQDSIAQMQNEAIQSQQQEQVQKVNRSTTSKMIVAITAVAIVIMVGILLLKKATG